MLLYLLLPRKAFAPSLVPGPDPRWSLQLAAVVWSQAFYYRPHLPQQGKAVAGLTLLPALLRLACACY